MQRSKLTHVFQGLRPTWSIGSVGSTIAIMVLALLIMAPVLVVLSSLVVDARSTWQHLADTVLLRYVVNSLLLMVGVGSGVLVVGVGTAWLVTLCDFWGVTYLRWGLLLPLAAPAYVLAYTYTDWLDVFGPVQQWLREQFQWQYGDYWFPNVRSLWGAVLMLVLVLYPYVYLLARVAFLQQATAILEASRALGCNPWQGFVRVALPLARPAITAGVALALMETLGDFGTVKHFGVDTFTTGIYRVWLAMDERPASMQMAAVLLLSVLGLLGVERWSRGQARYFQTSSQSQGLPRYPLQGWRGIMATIVCWVPVGLGFLLPMGLLLRMALTNPDADDQFWFYGRNSLVLAILAAGLTVAIALIIAYSVRLQPQQRSLRLAAFLCSMGYAIPGSVIAVGIMLPINRVNNAIDAVARQLLGISTGLLFSGVVAVIFAYVVRFLAISMQSVESGLGKVRPSFDEAARSLGHTPTSILGRIHLPILSGSLLSALLLVFVDVMKELPATLIIRPFNFDTLAIRTYQLASDERLAEAAPAALGIISVGLIPVLILSWQIGRSRSAQ